MLFQKDIGVIDRLIRENLDVVKAEDASLRLDHSQFGYRSNHYICKIPKSWETLPSCRGLAGLPIEIQSRTLSQHMWAAASHLLQYKREESVPQELRRSINRVSAILELVDIEFSRIISDREAYISDISGSDPAEELNVDLVSSILADVFPEENRSNQEEYDSLLTQLIDMNLLSAREFSEIMKRNLKSALEEDRKQVLGQKSESDFAEDADRVERGVYFTHVGLARQALRDEFGAIPGDMNYSSKIEMSEPPL